MQNGFGADACMSVLAWECLEYIALVSSAQGGHESRMASMNGAAFSAHSASLR